MAESPDATSGAVSGAASGAAIGTAIVPGIGTAIGAVAGALFGGVFGGKSAAKKKKAQAKKRRLANLGRYFNRQAAITGAFAEKAAVEVAGVGQGVGSGSSGVRGAASSVRTQLNTQLGREEFTYRQTGKIQDDLESANKFGGYIDTLAGAGSAATSISAGFGK